MLDELFLFGSLGVWVVIGVIFILYRIKSGKEKNFIFFLILNIVIGLIISYTWFYHIAKDGFSEVLGVLLYGIIALISIAVETIICNIKGSSQGIDLDK